MVALTPELIKKRSEHNEGMISTLEEIALHQQEIERIQSLEQCCRHVKIVLLQNNAISRMENLSKLRELEYLNLALNNIEVIDGVDGCESLKKLDLTVNFIYPYNVRKSLRALKNCLNLQDLYLTGNPCDEFVLLRLYCVAHIPSLQQFNGELVTRQERIAAWQQREDLELALDECALTYITRQRQGPAGELQYEPYTPQLRLEMNRELAEQKEKKEKNERERMGVEPKAPREVPGVYNGRGEIRQCNEGKFDFHLDTDSQTERDEIIKFELALPKHLDTCHIDVDVAPTYVRVVVKEKLTQLRLPEEVTLEGLKVQRSRLTGMLVVKMKKLVPPHRSSPTGERLTAAKRAELGLPDVELRGADAARGGGGSAATQSAAAVAMQTAGQVRWCPAPLGPRTGGARTLGSVDMIAAAASSMMSSIVGGREASNSGNRAAFALRELQTVRRTFRKTGEYGPRRRTLRQSAATDLDVHGEGEGENFDISSSSSTKLDGGNGNFCENKNGKGKNEGKSKNYFLFEKPRYDEPDDLPPLETVHDRRERRQL